MWVDCIQSKTWLKSLLLFFCSSFGSARHSNCHCKRYYESDSVVESSSILLQTWNNQRILRSVGRSRASKEYKPHDGKWDYLLNGIQQPSSLLCLPRISGSLHRKRNWTCISKCKLNWGRWWVTDHKFIQIGFRLIIKSRNRKFRSSSGPRNREMWLLLPREEPYVVFDKWFNRHTIKDAHLRRRPF